MHFPEPLPTFSARQTGQTARPAQVTSSPGFLGSLVSYVGFSSADTQRSSIKRTYGQHEQERQEDTGYSSPDSETIVTVVQTTTGPVVLTRHHTNELEQYRKNASETSHGNDQESGGRERNSILSERRWEAKERKWKAAEREWMAKEKGWDMRFRADQLVIDQLKHELDENTKVFKNELAKTDSEKASVQDQHNAFIRKQQEASFKQMESARWIPMEEGKVMNNLATLKGNIRTWAKSAAMKDISSLEVLFEKDNAALRIYLQSVAILENDRLPEGLSSTTRGPMLLLVAVLSHTVYTSFFRSPFFFLEKYDQGNATTEKEVEQVSSVQSLPNNAGREMLEDIYNTTKNGMLAVKRFGMSLTILASPGDSHTWRSQTLRLLLPPVREDTTEEERNLRRTTEGFVEAAANHHASAFLASPATLLMIGQSTSVTEKLRKIFKDAAKLAYALWTRRTEMKCTTLNDVKDLLFDPDSEIFEPDGLVRYEDHQDLLEGRKVTIMVHPLLQAFGSDEATDYDQARTWAKGVVWLNSKNDAK